MAAGGAVISVGERTSSSFGSGSTRAPPKRSLPRISVVEAGGGIIRVGALAALGGGGVIWVWLLADWLVELAPERIMVTDS